MDSLFNKDEGETYTDMARSISHEVYPTLVAVMKKYADLGYSVREIADIITEDVSELKHTIILKLL